MKVAGVGAGYFAQFHYAAWAKMDGVNLVGACDFDANKAAATGAPTFTELGDMLSITQPDILDIITPPSGHAACIRSALAAGVRAIICQKPFCTSLAEAKEMTDLARTADIPLIIHENFRFQPWYRTARDQIKSGAIGDPMQLTFRLRTGDGQGREAYLARQPYFQTMPKLLIHETGVHWVDVFRFLFGRPIAVYADLRRINPAIKGEDAGLVIFEFEGGKRAIFDGNRLLDHAAEDHRKTLGEGLFEGSAGTLELRGDGSLQLRKFGETESRTVLESKSYDSFGGDCVAALQRHVAEGLASGGSFENEASDYLFVREVEDAIYRSAEIGARVVL